MEQPQFPDRTKEATEAALYRAEQARLAAEAQAAELLAAQQAQAAYTASQQLVYGTLTGSYGYLSPLNNCVLLAEQYGKVQAGNPISWSISTHTPFIGAAALFYYNHVGIVTGIWSNGDIEVAQANARGAGSRYSQSEIRGYF